MPQKQRHSMTLKQSRVRCYVKRLAAGKCGRCGKVKETVGAQCQKCLDRLTERRANAKHPTVVEGT